MTLQPTDAAAQREPGDTGVPDDSDRADEAVGLRGRVKRTEQRATADRGHPRCRVHDHVVHAATSMTMPPSGRPSRPCCATAPGDRRDHAEVAVTGKADGHRDLGGTRRAKDDGRSPVEHRVGSTGPWPVVRRVVGQDDVAPEQATELVECAGVQDGSPVRRHAAIVRRRRPGRTARLASSQSATTRYSGVSRSASATRTHDRTCAPGPSVAG